jgi:Phosphorylase superfamily
MPPDVPVNAVCAMGVEAWGVRRRAPNLHVVQVGIGGRPPVGLHGIVISAGLCGGLLPEQTPGTVVIPTQVVDERGVTHACDPGVVLALQKAARYLRLPVTGGSLISTSGMVTGTERATWAGRGHVAVDMESAAAAESAQRFGVLRVILDTPSHELSAAWANPARAIRQPANWSEAIWLGVNAPRYALRVGAVLEAAFLGNIDPEV